MPSRPPVRIALAGLGAFGDQHLEALTGLADAELAEVVAVVDPHRERAERAADTHGVPFAGADLAEVLDRDTIDAVILCTPTPVHAEQALAVLAAGKHVQVEIPLATSWADAQRVADAHRDTGLIAMVGHTRRFNPSHRWIRARVAAGRLRLQHLEVQTHFLRRRNVNARGEPRSWTYHLLWHHAAHTVDLLRYQTGEPIVAAGVMQGPPHPELGIAMDLSVQLRTAGGTLCTLSLSFNDDGPLGSVFRYIGDTGTYVARYDELSTGHGERVELGSAETGVALQDREFVAAIHAGRRPEADLSAVLPSYRILAELEEQLGQAAMSTAPHRLEGSPT